MASMVPQASFAGNVSPLFEEYLLLVHEKGKDMDVAPIEPIGPKDGLLVIDMQHDFVPFDANTNPRGGAFGVAEGQLVVQPIVTMIEQAVNVGATVVATRDYHPVDHCSFNTESGPFPPHCVQGTEGSKLLPPIAEALAAGKTSSPDNVHVVFKAFHEDADSFGGMPYNPGPVYTGGGEGRVNTRAPGNKEQHCPMGCTKTPWTGAMLLKQSATILAVNNGKVTADDINSPPDILAMHDEEKQRERRPLQELVKDCQRLFVCGLALDFCCLDTCLNAVALGFKEVYMVLDSQRAAHIEKVGTFGTGFLSPPAALLPTLEKSGVKVAWTAQVAGVAAMLTPPDHFGMHVGQGPGFPTELPALAFKSIGSANPQVVKLEGDDRYTINMDRGDLASLKKIGWGNTGKRSPTGPILPGWPGAPEGATMICWAYPLADTAAAEARKPAELAAGAGGKYVQGLAGLKEAQASPQSARSNHAFLKLSRSLELSFAIRGGFLLLSASGEVLEAQLVIPGGSAERMEFGDPVEIPADKAAALKAKRMQDVTLPHLIRKGARNFCWLHGGEDIEGFAVPEKGAYAYIVEGQHPICFPVKGFAAPEPAEEN